MNKYKDRAASDIHRSKANRIGGQSLVEILVALGIGVILIGGVTTLISVDLRSSSESKTNQVVASLTQEMIDSVRSIAESDWKGFYGLSKGPTNKYYIASSTLVAMTGTESLTVGTYGFTRYFYIENVNRTRCGIGSPVAVATTADCAGGFPIGEGSIAEDPSTQKVSVVVEWTGGGSAVQIQYVSRTRNGAIRQTDWSGGGGDNSVITVPNNKYSVMSGLDATTTVGSLSVVLAGGGNLSTTANIDSGAANHWAWNDTIGWIDAGYGPGNVGVNDAKLFGYASSSIGLIAFDCATTPNGNICAGPAGNWKVSNVGGTLQGWAYSDAVGWISFDSPTAIAATGQGSASYGVSIATDGSLGGFAWNDAIGWISFNCANQGTCASQGGYDYKVKTSWLAVPITGSLTSSIFDLGGPVALNALIWRGTANGGTVRFQVAASNVSNPASWNYKGPDGTATTTYAAVPDVSTQLSPRDFSGVRYVRYKVFIDSNGGHTASPSIQDIILNYGI
jgi:type II secretory pathway pseudopilin PulG